jgi:threonine aldolase
MRIDLRSDTVTKPTKAMLEAMWEAKVGDDVYGEDTSINQLQDKMAGIFGMEAALFCPSGTMTNQIAIKVLTQPQDEVICYKGAHIYKYEGGGLFFNSQVSVKLLDSDRGRISAQDVEDNINANDIHYPRTAVVALENTANRGGGSIYDLSEIEKIHAVARKHQLKMHLDGARLFNALVAKGEKAQDHARYFDTISVCLSKGLGCPVGSVVLGTKAHIDYAKRIRKAFGGAMRQAGFLAAAGIYALDNHIDRLDEDHQRAKVIGDFLATKSYIEYVYPVETNIILFEFPTKEVAQSFHIFCRENQILLGATDKRQARMVTHLDFDDAQLEALLKRLGDFV